MSAALSVPALATPTLVRLPCTPTRRGALTHAKLLRKVRPDPAWGGYAFEGDLYRPGQQISQADLRPTEEYPETPLVLEFAGSVGRRPQSKLSNYLHVLWRYGEKKDTWLEIARAISPDNDWTIHLGPAALEHIRRKPVLVDPLGAAARVAAAIEAELEPLSHPDKKLVMLAVYDHVQAKVVGW